MPQPQSETKESPRDHLLAILAADAVGYSSVMTADGRGAVAALDRAREVFRRNIGAHGGHVIDTAGDSVLAAFESAGAALRAALAVQARLDPALPFRIGLHLGDVIEKADGSVYGDGVNIAARLQALAEPGGILISQAIHAIVVARKLATFEDLGERTLKNIAAPVRVWRVRTTSQSLRFGPDGRFELHSRGSQLLAGGKPVNLGELAFDLLLALASRPGTLLSKNELIRQAWAGLDVEEAAVATQISALRRVVGADVITTIPGRGYRFTACVDSAGSATASATMPGTTAPAAPAATPLVTPSLRTNLPRPLPALLGRVDDLAALGALIDQHPLVSVVGAGGMGKSLLTQHLLDGRRAAYRHGVCWVELATVENQAGLPAAVAAALGVQVSGSDALAALCEAVAPLSMLVALDNAEHVLDGVARTVLALMAAAPQVRWVVTSQAPLKLGAERVYRIGSLAVPQGPLPPAQALAFGAVALFTERAQAADARFQLNDANAPAVIELCRALDGLALAIELAAARAPMLGVQRLVSSMQDRLKLLTSNLNRAAPARQLTLRATLDWSHAFLDERERTVFRRLAVFGGSGSLAMIQQVVADPEGDGALDEWAVLDALGVLVDRSMVAVLASDDAAEPRYRLLDSPRAYALERLQQAGEEAELRRRHMRAMVAFCAADHAVASYKGETWIRAMELDLDNLRDAMAHAVAEGDSVAAVQIGVTRRFAMMRQPLAQHFALTDEIAPLLNDRVPPELQVRWWLGVSLAFSSHGRRAHEAARLALDVLQQAPGLADHRILAYRTWCRIAETAIGFPGDRARAETALAEARKLEDPAWPPWRLMLRTSAETAAAHRGSAESLRLVRKMLSLAVAFGSSGYGARVNLIDNELAAGDAQAAAVTGEALLADLEGGRDERSAAYARMMLMAAQLALDDTGRARQVALVGWPQAQLFQLEPSWGDYLALLAALEGRQQAAARLAGYADAGYAAREIMREPNEAAAVARARALAVAALGDAEVLRLLDEGTVLRDDQIAAIAFGVSTPVDGGLGRGSAGT